MFGLLSGDTCGCISHSQNSPPPIFACFKRAGRGLEELQLSVQWVAVFCFSLSGCQGRFTAGLGLWLRTILFTHCRCGSQLMKLRLPTTSGYLLLIPVKSCPQWLRFTHQSYSSSGNAVTLQVYVPESRINPLEFRLLPSRCLSYPLNVGLLTCGWRR